MNDRSIDDARIGATMQLNRVASTDVHLSAVGFGTFQLQLVPERQAVDTLVRGFELGVNWVHTSHEYGGAEPLIAQAISRLERRIIVLNQASGEPAYMDAVFEKTRRMFGNADGSLEMFGINCIDDAELREQNVWGPGGLVELLKRKKEQGRVRALFCSTHGSPDYVARLITCGVFDAVMIPYNPLGFHALSYFEEAVGRQGEDLEQNRERIFPLASANGVALLVMKPLAGGLMCRGKAFPPRAWLSGEHEHLAAGDVLRGILEHPAVCAVVPGTASTEEAEENARAGHRPVLVGIERSAAIGTAIDEMRATICSRCGACHSSCSQRLPISFMFRDGYIWNYRSESAVVEDYLCYFALHSSKALACHTCQQQTCACPSGIDIPAALGRLHGVMIELRQEELLPPTPDEALGRWVQQRHWAQLVSKELPSTLSVGDERACRLWLHNSGTDTWHAPLDAHVDTGLALGVFIDGRLVGRVPLRHDVESGQRTNIAFSLRAPRRSGMHRVSLCLMPWRDRSQSARSSMLLTAPLRVDPRSMEPNAFGSFFRRWLRR
jgi:predicted aldo/keto reductase-like oxidoreductase